MNATTIKESDLRKISQQAGLQVLGWTSELELAEDLERLDSWQKSEFNGEMGFMARPKETFKDLSMILPEARSIVLFAVHYGYQAREERRPEHGLVARYAWGMDYHLALRSRLEAFVSIVRDSLGIDIQSRSFTDSVPILERAFAKKSGLGFIGKNSMLIQKGMGSYFLIGEVIWDLEIEKISTLQVVSDDSAEYDSDCSTCTRCIDVCPTQAILEPMLIDARKCISYLSIEKKRMLSVLERKSLGQWVFGCDECQDCCPFNHRSLSSELPPAFEEFSSKHGVGQQLNLRALFELKTNKEFELRFKNTPLLRPRRSGLIRNGICTAVNTSSESLLDIIALLAKEDSSPIIRAHALWAVCELQQLSRDGLSSDAKNLIDCGLRDESDLVRGEAKSLAAA